MAAESLQVVGVTLPSPGGSSGSIPRPARGQRQLLRPDRGRQRAQRLGQAARVGQARLGRVGQPQHRGAGLLEARRQLLHVGRRRAGGAHREQGDVAARHRDRAVAEVRRRPALGPHARGLAQLQRRLERHAHQVAAADGDQLVRRRRAAPRPARPAPGRRAAPPPSPAAAPSRRRSTGPGRAPRPPAPPRRAGP